MENEIIEQNEETNEVIEPEVVETENYDISEGTQQDDDPVKIIDGKMLAIAIPALMAAGYGVGCLAKKGIAKAIDAGKKWKQDHDAKKLKKLQATVKDKNEVVEAEVQNPEE